MNENQEFKNVARKFKERNRRKSIFLVLGTVFVLFGIWFGIYAVHFPTKYEEGFVTILDQQEPAFFRINKRDYFAIISFYQTEEVDGNETQIMYFYFIDNIWTRFFSRGRENSESNLAYINIHDDMESWPAELVGHTGETSAPISRIYYVNNPRNWPRDVHVTNLTAEDISAMEPVLVWER